MGVSLSNPQQLLGPGYPLQSFCFSEKTKRISATIPHALRQDSVFDIEKPFNINQNYFSQNPIFALGNRLLKV
ncbi:MAG TPA: hypothetical protein DCP54_07395 [Chryseobacterium sp.]|nr:hypothetical protein [Chryseobacterium sp.]